MAPSTLPSITIAAAELTGAATLVVTPVDDDFFEGDETIEVQGSAAGLAVTGTMQVQLDSGVKTARCEESVHPLSLTCQMIVELGDYDFDGYAEIAEGALQLTWHEVGDPSVTWPVPTSPGGSRVMGRIYGGHDGVDQASTCSRDTLVVRHAIIFGCRSDLMAASSTTCQHRIPEHLAVALH